MKFVLLALALFVAAAAAAPSQKNDKDALGAIVMPEPAIPEVVGGVAEELPVPQGTFGEIFNDGNVQVTVNAPEEPGMFGTLKSWFNMVINYISDGVQTSQQIV